MDDYRSKSFSHGGGMQLERYTYEQRGPTISSSNNNPPRDHGHDFRSYSVSYASSYAPPQLQDGGVGGKDFNKFKKGKSTNGSASKTWNFNDPEFQRKRRVASYKVYSVEGMVKGSFRKSFRWIKDKYTHVVYGWR